MGANNSKAKPSSIEVQCTEDDVDTASSQHNRENMWLSMPNELLNIILGFLDSPQAFQNCSLTCKKLAILCQDKEVQYTSKNRFAKRQTSLLNLILHPGGERIFIRHHYILPNGTKYGEETIWNHSVKLQLMLRDSGLCLQGVVDTQDKILANRKYWEDGRVVGEELAFFSNGKEQFVRFWNDQGNLHGEEIVWYENGNMKAKNYRENGVLEGVQQGWYEEGNSSFVRLWHNGVLEGPEKQWDKQGQLTTHVIWPVNNKGKKIDCLKKQRKLEKKSNKSKSFFAFSK